jgi:hypothetical protein
MGHGQLVFHEPSALRHRTGIALGDGMLKWWLNLRWGSKAYEETLAKIDLAILLFGATVLVAVALRA